MTRPITVRQKNITGTDCAIAVIDQNTIVGISGSKMEIRRPKRSMTMPAANEPNGEAKLFMLAYHELVLSSIYNGSVTLRT